MSTKRHALVTGTSSGIGKAIAELLLTEHWQVTGLDIAPSTIQHPHFSAQQIDLCDECALEAASKSLASVDAFVHAAGVLRIGTVGALSMKDATLMWQLHVAAACIVANQVLPAMQASKSGRVVLIGSRVAAGVAGRSTYGATKAALLSLARSWAAEVVSDGVTVNVVSPAATATAMLSDPARVGAAPKVPPIGRLIEPREIAATVAFLLSPNAAAITGQDIQLCGGASLAR